VRKRYRFLDFLPLACDFVFCELDLTHMLSASTIALHRDLLDSRHRARQRAKRAERVAAARSDAAARRELNELQAYLAEMALLPPPEEPPALFMVAPAAAADPAAAAAAAAERGPAPPSFRDVVRGSEPEPPAEPPAPGSFAYALMHSAAAAAAPTRTGWGARGAPGKKKGQKKVVLLSTGGARHS
jgi:hypothetical protein